MSRQLADKARLFAQQTVDRRRAAERNAVEAAGIARQTENEISRYQKGMTDSADQRRRLEDARRQLEEEIDRLENQTFATSTPEESTTGGDGAASGGNATGDDAGNPSDSGTAETGEETPSSQALEEQRRARLATARRERDEVNQRIDEASATEAIFRDRAQAAIAALDALRSEEVRQREVMNREQAREDRAVEEQFRLEVIAADEDPDTYAKGNPSSKDPVAQVTLSVIGEGLIQMRGPRKGVNLVHTMINEIDAPVGQVRVGLHTIQINGERGDRMEEVAARIQRYTDHSRFLTSQSAQMLRNAVAVVASRKAQAAGLICDPVTGQLVESAVVLTDASGAMLPPELNAAQHYQDAFFGSEFMQQLRVMDSEFVRNGNLLLSLHSMDTTSLASALFMLSLASNQTRMEILHEFQTQTTFKLPCDEFEYFDASDTKRWYQFRKFRFMADNARFVSLRGYFDAEIVGDNTISPAQREFLKLAQILKSRLITEVELKQRIVERALIEERIGDYDQQLRDAAAAEDRAREKVGEVSDEFKRQLTGMLDVARQVASQDQAHWNERRDELRREIEAEPRRLFESLKVAANTGTNKSIAPNAGQDDAVGTEESLATTVAVKGVVESTRREAVNLIWDERISTAQKRSMLLDQVSSATRQVAALTGDKKSNDGKHAITLTLDEQTINVEFDPQLNESAMVRRKEDVDVLRKVGMSWVKRLLFSDFMVDLSDSERADVVSALERAESELKKPEIEILNPFFAIVEAIHIVKRSIDRAAAARNA
ncbi:MAG: hypothetical protein KDA85_22645, partial [Planctomycetaceae bacterium]|nr:hypothetical protein [Planctomycetaceae bacterium]